MGYPTYDTHPSLRQMANDVAAVNRANGWYANDRSFGDDMALLHSEVSEAFEAFRNDNWSGEKDSVQCELADVLIRLLDTCHRYDIDLEKFFRDTLERNRQRSYKHGGKLL